MPSATPFDLELPHPGEFARLGVTREQELEGGHQSRVVRVTEHDGVHSHELVIKLSDARFLDPVIFANQIELVRELALRDDRVVGPVTLGGATINRLGDWFGVAYPRIAGRSLDVTNRGDVERMGRALARLHESLLPLSAKLPHVAALRAVEDAEVQDERHYQVLHGDFSTANLLLDADQRLWVFDFDDCGYGPVEFDVGNTLFMTLFATSRSFAEPSPDYRQFRKWFVGSYIAARLAPTHESLIERAVGLRNSALIYWLDHLEVAPIGVRFSPPEWHERLRRFTGS